MPEDDTGAFSTHRRIPSERTDLPFDSYILFNGHPQPLERYTGAIFGMTPAQGTESIDAAQHSFRNAAQLRAHDLIDDAALLAYFAKTAAHERMIPREVW